MNFSRYFKMFWVSNFNYKTIISIAKNDPKPLAIDTLRVRHSKHLLLYIFITDSTTKKERKKTTKGKLI